MGVCGCGCGCGCAGVGVCVCGCECGCGCGCVGVCICASHAMFTYMYYFHLEHLNALVLLFPSQTQLPHVTKVTYLGDTLFGILFNSAHLTFSHPSGNGAFYFTGKYESHFSQNFPCLVH